ncbi:MAG: hypothetical protein LBB59_00470 [Campylobacteraceae bacterium]|jgi:hypothetical protein|nr:hypothetical protein [Campylobacteraceae bacterium]
MKTMRIWGILMFLLLSVCNADGAKNSFDGTWEFTKNEMHRYTFNGGKYEEYSELEGEFGEHYYKGTFTYKEISPGYGSITFKQTHSAVTNGAWTPSEEDSEVTTIYKFIDDTTLNIGGGGISGALYYKK